MKRLTILTAAMALALPATAHASLCFYPDSTLGAPLITPLTEQRLKAVQCWKDQRDWVYGYSGYKLLTVINSTASRWQMTGFNLHPKALVDWDSAAENSQPGLPLPAGYWVTVYQ